jgi:5-methylcytosine-specific restriction protein A
MGFSDITEPKAVSDAIEEFDRLGREKFLETYGFGKARKYYLVVNGKYYDSKAILGVAHKYQFPAKEPLKWSDFNGGKLTVQAKLEELGFTVEVK